MNNTTRSAIPCPISTCRWSFHSVATPAGWLPPSDLLEWTPATWALAAEPTDALLTTAQIVDAHLATHKYPDWMAEVRLIGERAKAAKEFCAALAAALDRMPSRTQYGEAKRYFTGAATGIGPRPTAEAVEFYITPAGRQLVEAFAKEPRADDKEKRDA